jgi:hypothetical protein
VIELYGYALAVVPLALGCIVLALVLISRRLERPIAKADRKFGGEP